MVLGTGKRSDLRPVGRGLLGLAFHRLDLAPFREPDPDLGVTGRTMNDLDAHDCPFSVREQNGIAWMFILPEVVGPDDADWDRLVEGGSLAAGTHKAVG